MNFPKRADLHCHSRASTEADEALLQAIRCPESYSDPRDIHAQATRRNMDFVTITDHDAIAGIQEIASLPNTFVGEELTCYFPEDRCKIHLLLWGITLADHAALQHAAHDIYAVARYVEQNRIPHAVAHPLYRQNGILNRRHIERLLLLFKGFECLNGAHSTTHREVFEPLLEDLDQAEILRLEHVHRMDALWPKPWQKTRTGGSDDHGLFNIGRTWTEFPADTQTVPQLLDCLLEGRCRPGGEAGSSVKLAHNFFGVGMRYYTRQVAQKDNDFSTSMMRRMLGEEPPPTRLSIAATAANLYARGIPKKIGRMLGLRKPPRGTELLRELLVNSAITRARDAKPLVQALREGRAPFAEHQSMFDFVCAIDRDVSSGIFNTFASAVDNGQVGAVIDAVSTVIAQQALLFPYFFALFHQNQERDLLDDLSKRYRAGAPEFPRVGIFTDTTDESTAAGKLARDLGRFAESRGLAATILAASSQPEPAKNWRHFQPAIDKKISAIPFDLKIPPVLEILESADRSGFDCILVNGAGPMALVGWLVAKMLRAPLVAIFHDDLPARMLEMTGGDFRATAAVEAYIAWFYRSAGTVLTTGNAAEKISGIRIQRLPLEDRMDCVWDACLQASRPRREMNEKPSMEVIGA